MPYLQLSRLDIITCAMVLEFVKALRVNGVLNVRIEVSHTLPGGTYCTGDRLVMLFGRLHRWDAGSSRALRDNVL